MRVGALLPTFEPSAAPALDAAARCAAAGVDGVFAFDHLWPMGEPEKPALAPFPLLAAVGARHRSLSVGPLVARVGLRTTEALLEQFHALALVAEGGVIAALGTGDKLSEQENDAYGLPRRTSDERRALLVEAATALAPRMEVWIGAGAERTNALARELAVTLNYWRADAEVVARAAGEGPVSWAGRLRADAAAHLDELADAGASYAVAMGEGAIPAVGAWRATHPG